MSHLFTSTQLFVSSPNDLQQLTSDISEKEIFIVWAIMIEIANTPATSASQIGTKLARLTNDRIHLHIYRQFARDGIRLPYMADRQAYVVQWAGIVYGSLHIQITRLPLEREQIQEAECLAKWFGWLLASLDTMHFLHSQFPFAYTSLQAQSIQTLSPQGTRILHLMVRGYDAPAIAHHLTITVAAVHKMQQRIYIHLGVHSAAEACYIALCAGFLMPSTEE